MEKIKGEKIMTKYLKTKPGSLEEITIKILQESPYDSEIKKAPSRHSQSKGKLLLEPKKDDMKHQPDVKKEATSQDISPSLENKPVNKKSYTKNEVMDTSWIKKEIDKEKKTTLVAAPGNKEKVIRIPKEKLADYKAKGYVEAEEFVPEETVTEEPKNAYAIGMAAAMKATGDKPPLKKSTIVKAHDIAKKIEKNEEVKTEELKGNQVKLDKNKNGKLDADDFKKLRKEEDEDAEKMNKKQKDSKGEKEIIKIAKYEEETVKEAAFKAIDTDTQELKRLRVRLTKLRDSERAAAGADTTGIEKQIHQTRGAILDLQKKQLLKHEDVDADKMNKKQKEVKGEKEVINKLKEGKMNYKSYKKSLKKEEENSKNMKSTMTGKPVTKIDTEPKLNKYN